MKRARPAALALFALALLLRVVGLPAWGTFDVEVQKAWAAAPAQQGLADIYGPSDAEAAERRRNRCSRCACRAPSSVGDRVVLRRLPAGQPDRAVGGRRAVRAFDAELENRRGFNAAINLAPLLGSLVIAWLLLRGGAGRARRAERAWRSG
jgi:hypothetical protein